MTGTAAVVFDPFSEEYFTNPYDAYRRMRDHAPVYYNEQYDFCALTPHADVAAALKDTDTYSSAKGVTLDQILLEDDPGWASIITMDPREHRRMRSLVNKVFTPPPAAGHLIAMPQNGVHYDEDTPPRRAQGRMANIAAMKPCGYTLDVLATDAADAVRAAGGLMFDRIHEGWTTRVFVLKDLDPRPLHILGAQGYQYDGIDVPAPPRPFSALALSSAALPRSDEIYQNTLTRLRRGCAEVTLWGNPPEEMQQHLVAMDHRLTSAARAFKACAWAACADGTVLQQKTERFHGSGTLCVPGNPDLTLVTVAMGWPTNHHGAPGRRDDLHPCKEHP